MLRKFKNNAKSQLPECNNWNEEVIPYEIVNYVKKIVYSLAIQGTDAKRIILIIIIMQKVNYMKMMQQKQLHIDFLNLHSFISSIGITLCELKILKISKRAKQVSAKVPTDLGPKMTSNS